jgi:hypothetical protein
MGTNIVKLGLEGFTMDYARLILGLRISTKQHGTIYKFIHKPKTSLYKPNVSFI